MGRILTRLIKAYMNMYYATNRKGNKDMATLANVRLHIATLRSHQMQHITLLRDAHANAQLLISHVISLSDGVEILERKAKEKKEGD